jgi:hypothetical protein
MDSSPAPKSDDDAWSASETVHDVLLRHEQARVDLAQAYAARYRSPLVAAADRLADVPRCLELVAELALLASGPDFTLR